MHGGDEGASGDPSRGGSWSVFEHTADCGLEIRAPDLQALFETAGRALCSLLADPVGIEPREERRIDVAGCGREELLVRWLSEILYLHEAEGFLACGFRAESIGEDRVIGVVAGEPYDPSRHTILAQIKAVTYHQIQVAQDSGAWRARVILDV